MSNKTRLDVLLVERGLEQTRQRAQAMIMSGLVFVDGQRVDKAGTAVPNDAQIEVRGNTLRYVSRGGLKLEKAMTTFGLKLCNWMAEIERDIDRMKHAKETISVGKISGAVGTYADIDPFVEKYVCEHLGIAASPISSQTLQRDRHAEYVTTLAVIASSIDKMATEIRHLQRTEVREAEEYFSPKQKGSSIMPHKRNPITCERMCGLARVIRGNAQAALEDVALWHERDISHSSVERVILPDSTIALDYMLQTFTRVIDKLLVYPDKMMKDLNLTGGLIYSPIILNTLVEKGAVREQAYRWVQRNAMKRWLEGEDFLENLKKDEDVTKYMTAEEIEGCFDVKKMLSHVDTIFARFGI